MSPKLLRTLQSQAQFIHFELNGLVGKQELSSCQLAALHMIRTIWRTQRQRALM
jgi:hypothetical protein